VVRLEIFASRENAIASVHDAIAADEGAPARG
jgi:hypothetical protein